MKLENAMSFADKKCKEDRKSGRKYYVMLSKEETGFDALDAFFVTIFPAKEDTKVASFRYGVRRW